jgi:hypothetical protein
MEKYLSDSIDALEYFSKHDPQAMQYSVIAKSLLSMSLDHIHRTELMERFAKGRASAELFGLPLGLHDQPEPQMNQATSSSKQGSDYVTQALPSGPETPNAAYAFTTSDWEDFDLSAFGDLSNDASQDLFGTLNLFPIFDANAEFDDTSIT